MTKENSFDRNFKESLYNYKSPVPAGLWEKIETDKRLKKAVPFWKKPYIIAAFISVALVAGFVNRKVENNTIFNKSISRNNLSNVKVSNNSNYSSKSVENYKKVGQINLVENEVVSKGNEFLISEKAFGNKKSISTLILDKRYSDKTKIASAISHKGSKKVQSNNSINPSSSYNPDVEASVINLANISSNTEANKATIRKPIESVEQELSNNLFRSKRKSDEIFATGKIKSIDSQHLANSVSANVVGYLSKSYQEILSYHLGNGQIVPKNFNLMNENVSDLILNNNCNLTVIHVPDVVKKNWYIDFFVSPDYNQTVKNNSGLSSFSKALDSTQRITNGFTVGTTITRNIGNLWKIKSGLQYKQVNERFFYIQQTIKNINVVTNRSYTDNKGSTVNVVDTASYLQSGYTIKTVFNSYKSVEIPLTIGLEGKLKHGLHFGLNTGLITTLYTYFQGKTMDVSNSIVPLGANQTNGFYHSVPSFSFYGSAELIYSVNNGIDVFASPYCRIGLTDNINSAVGYNKRYNSDGLLFGLRYRFSRAGNK